MMKKILFGILMLFLVALVPSVSATASFSGTIPTQSLTEDSASVSIIDLSTYFTCDVGLCDYDVTGDTNSLLSVNAGTGIVDFLAPADWFGTETVTFTVTDLGDSSTAQSNSVVLNVVNDNNDKPTASGTNPTSPITIDEEEQETITLIATGGVGEITYSIVTQPSHGSLSTIDPVLDQVVYTPSQNYYGTDSFSFKATNPDGDSNTFIVNININLLYDDAPVLPALDDYTAQEDILITNIVLPVATDADGVSDTTYYNLEVVSAPDESTFAKGYLYDDPTTTIVEKIITGWSGWNPTLRTISGWTPDKEDIGELKLRLVAYDSRDSLNVPSRDTKEFKIFIYPKTMCELGEMGNILDITIDSPDDNDDFGPGDKINIEVTVENDASEDKDVIVEAMLYDIKTQKKVEEVESDDENIDDDDDYKFELELQIPLDDDEDYKGDYVLYIKAYEDGKEDEQCLGEAVELDIGRESHEVIIQSMTITPSTLEPGDSIDVLVRALNTGRKDELGVTVKLRSTELEIDKTSDARDLAAYDESGNSYVYRFTDIKIPLSTRGKTYQLEAFVLYEDGATSTSYIDSPTFRLRNSQIVVEGEAILTETISVGSVEETAEGVLRIPVTVTNTEGKTGLTVGLTNINWAKEVDEQAISLVKGDSGTVYFDLELEDAEEGTESFTIQLKSNGQVIDSAARSIELTDDMLGSGLFGSIKGSTVLWVIGDIVLIIVAIFFVKLIFSARKKKLDIREVKL